MRHVALMSFALATGLPGLAHAYEVFPGCAVPQNVAGHHIFYVDPNKGSPSGDGSASKPWRTLQEVFANNLVHTKGHNGRTFSKGDTTMIDVNPKGPIKPGDMIMLMSGNHGDPSLLNLYNEQFISVVAAPGQSPILNTLTVLSSGRWVFQGLKIQSPVPTKKRPGLVTIGSGDWLGTVSDIIIDNNSVSTTDDTTSWTLDDWNTKAQGTGLYSYQDRNCISYTNNHVYNVLNGIALSSNFSLAKGNLIERIGNDGIDITASNLIIKGNTIKGGQNNNTIGYHADGIQGWSAKGVSGYYTNKNVTIDGNTIIKTGDPLKTYMMGISIFDGMWNNLNIQNNIVLVNHWNGIVVAGAQNSSVINNTVIGTNSTMPTLIHVAKSKDGTASKNMIVRNNISTKLAVDETTTTFDHNLALNAISAPNSKVVTSGVLGSANAVNANLISGFYNFNVATELFNLRLKPSSAAIGFGNPVSKPALDITGKARTAPVDAGAYVH